MLTGGLHTDPQARVCPLQVALPPQAEAMSVSSRLLAASAVLTALLALFWPQLESLVTTYLSHNGTDSKCPLVRRHLQLSVQLAHAPTFDAWLLVHGRDTLAPTLIAGPQAAVLPAQPQT